ncbi:hypothetical protein [Luteirhabdus pelagi]|uniref:hypothetical protein n=1 Tax=Luteirhabdus pelagi TaxID=2792783 RepID=UPI00193A11AA|nr:hypothetical protein [Luteirhabdus pelagi]
MGLFSHKNNPFNWYKYNLKFSIELLYGFVKSSENQIQISIDDYLKKVETTVIEEATGFPGSHQIIDHYNDLDSQTWNLDGVFKEHFPNLQRRSAFITLYSYLEHELDKLCILFKKSNNYAIELSDIKYNGIDRSVTYLSKIANLPIEKGDFRWGKLKSIQKIRNLIVHNDGKLIDLKGVIKESELKIVRENDFLDEESEILIKNGFLKSVLDSFNDFFMYLNELIEANCS